MNTLCRRMHCIVPPHMLDKLLENNDRNIRDAALATLLTTSHLRGERSARALNSAQGANGNARRTIFDCRNSSVLADAALARTEDGQDASDASVNRAFDGLGTTRDFYKDILKRDSIDGLGMRLNAFVHRGNGYQNAFWDGQQMIFGDGDGIVFADFTLSLDVIAHELTHGVTEFAAGLVYQHQPGALNESISDVFGCLVKQWSRGENAEEADWLIGSELFTPAIATDAMRSLKAPGTAYNNALFGKDPQPDHMKRYVVLPNNEKGDWGGVHINSGIPNKAFYLAAVGIGGGAWESAGHIWYQSLLASNAFTQFQEFADTTALKAAQIHGFGSFEHKAVSAAWDEVGIRTSSAMSAARSTDPHQGSRLSSRNTLSRDQDSFARFSKQIETLAAQVRSLSKDMQSLRSSKR